MHYIIFDLEATCWHDNADNKLHEIIEIGAVRLDNDLKIIDAFSQFVTPVMNPNLSDFCTELTSITQQMIDSAPIFAEAMDRFEQWISMSQDRGTLFVSWGHYDRKQLIQESAFKQYVGEIVSLIEHNHMSLKHEFARVRKIRTCGMAKALRMLDLPLEGSHHRGIDDAKNIAKIFQRVFPSLR